jgi:hypothetical protein
LERLVWLFPQKIRQNKIILINYDFILCKF